MMPLAPPTPQKHTGPSVLHHFTVRVVRSQVVDVEVSLPGSSALVAKDYVTELLDAGENKLTQLDMHFGGYLTWSPCYWKVVSAEQCSTTREE